ncbi:MAG TPA: XrtA system polysaccharide deacetylase [Gemmatimonadaceae bacterium]|nr:XrtA system polysaccharide deacetylase [Gemmatimonadaceae bacterium]
MAPPPRPTHHFTIDVEEYFQVVALEHVVRRSWWGRMGSRVEREMDVLLELLDAASARATCFTLGWIAEHRPELVRRLSAAGHEIASHGWDHVRVTHQSPAEFRRSVRESKAVLEDLTGLPVLGFRAPSFSIVPGLEWALDILLEEGYRYDSSLFPIRRPDGYGYEGAGRDPHQLERPSGSLIEFPLTTLRIGRLNLPAAGGGYFRLLPYALVRAGFRSCERRGMPGTFYVHPWEIDAEQPRLPVSTLTRLRHYGGLAGTRARLERLLREFRFRPIVDTLREIDLRGAHSPAMTLPSTLVAASSTAGVGA